MPAAKTFYGPFTILKVERFIGPGFEDVWMKPYESWVFRGPQGQRPLTAVGMTWPCGCEVRGSSYVMLRTSHWAPCPAHREILDGLPPCDLPTHLEGGIRVPRDAGTYKPDRVLIEAIPGSL